MEMLISPEWLRNKIESDQDENIEAGIPTEALDTIRDFLPVSNVPEVAVYESSAFKLKHAFSLLMRGLRLEKKLSLEKLAEVALVDVEDLKLIESDPHYQAKPRTLYQLSNFYSIEMDRIMQLSGATIKHDDQFEEEVLRFAAKSDGVSSLNKKERQVLNEFVKFLNES